MTDEKLKQIQKKHINENTRIYNENKELLDLYNQYINNIVELFAIIKENKKSDFYYTMIFNILMEMGFFSFNRTFNSKDKKFKELPIKHGLNIVNGEGICRHIASFYEDIFSAFYNYPLKICCFYPQGSQNENTRLYGNHVINLTYYHDMLYGFDITNHCIYTPINDTLLKRLENDDLLTYTPGGNLLFKLLTLLKETPDLFNEVNEIKEMLLNSCKLKPMSKEDYYQFIIQTNKYITEKEKLLKDFIMQNEELTYEIKKKMLLLKK